MVHRKAAYRPLGMHKKASGLRDNTENGMFRPSILLDREGPGFLGTHMGVSKDNGTPKWMVYNGKPY